MQFVIVALLLALGLSMVIAGGSGVGPAGLFNTITGHTATGTGKPTTTAPDTAGTAATNATNAMTGVVA